jgi:hypothetical protein
MALPDMLAYILSARNCSMLLLERRRGLNMGKEVLPIRTVFSTRLDPGLVKKLKQVGVGEGKAVNELLEEAIRLLLEERKKGR